MYINTYIVKYFVFWAYCDVVRKNILLCLVQKRSSFNRSVRREKFRIYPHSLFWAAPELPSFRTNNLNKSIKLSFRKTTSTVGYIFQLELFCKLTS